MRQCILFALTMVLLCGCTLVKYASIQEAYSRAQRTEPRQKNLKHMIDQETYYVIGRALDETCDCPSASLAIAAYSDKFQKNELVDVMFFTNAGTHFGLNLPAGIYQLIIFMDSNHNSMFENNEIVGQKIVTLNKITAPDNVIDKVEIALNTPITISEIESVAKTTEIKSQESFFFPSGTIRSFDDEIFETGMGTLGMYEPAAFLDKAKTLFFALEEDVPYKIPVVFVHGIGGSVRQFKPIVDKLDRNRYKPWFFYYPSGSDLNQLAKTFYSVFLSGQVARLDETPLIIVAHSMGGLVVREAINQYENNEKENTIALLFTIASPLNGHTAAALGEKHSFIVLPAWRDLNPGNPFIKNLFRKSLPESINYQLLYAYNNISTLKFGENSDGVVTLSSQLRREAQDQATEQFGFDDTHSGILENDHAIDYILNAIYQVKGPYPESHLEILFKGGYDLPEDPSIDPLSRYIIRISGRYMSALVDGEIESIHPLQTQFINSAKGNIKAATDLEKSWIIFQQKYPELINSSSSR
ncbi:hypothetical protein NBRC116493_12000 [Aurantivibrio infirmus]